MQEKLLAAEKAKHEFIKQRNSFDVNTILFRRASEESKKRLDNIKNNVKINRSSS